MVRTLIRDDQAQDISFVSEREFNDFFADVVITGTENDTTVQTSFDNYLPSRGIFVGTDGNVVTTGTNTIQIAGFRDDFVSASGSLQTQIDGLDLQQAYDNGASVLVVSGTPVTISGLTGSPFTSEIKAGENSTGLLLLEAASAFQTPLITGKNSGTSDIVLFRREEEFPVQDTRVELGGVLASSFTLFTPSGSLMRSTVSDSLNAAVLETSPSFFRIAAGLPSTSSGSVLSLNAGTDGFVLVNTDGADSKFGVQSSTLTNHGVFQVDTESNFCAINMNLFQDPWAPLVVVYRAVVSGIVGSEFTDITNNEIITGSGTFTESLTVSGIPVATGNNLGNVVDSLNGLGGDLTIAGTNGISIITNDPTITISGFQGEFISASGSLQSQIDAIGVDEIEDALTGGDNITVTSGSNEISIALDDHITLSSGTFSQFLTVSGAPVATGTVGEGTVTLQQAYDAGNTITLAPSNNLEITITSGTTTEFVNQDPGKENILHIEPEQVGIKTNSPEGTFDTKGAIRAQRSPNDFGTTSPYTCLILDGNIGDGDNSALYAIGRGSASNEPFVGLCGADAVGTQHMQLYFGGGGWTAPAATKNSFWAQPTYDNNLGSEDVECMTIISAANVGQDLDARKVHRPRVGIGTSGDFATQAINPFTTDPKALLHVESLAVSGTDNTGTPLTEDQKRIETVRISMRDLGADNDKPVGVGPILTFYTPRNSLVGPKTSFAAYIGAIKAAPAGNRKDAHLVIGVKEGNAGPDVYPVERMRITTDGDFGFKTTTPEHTFHLIGSAGVGDITISGTTVNMSNLPTSSGALNSGDLWVDTANDYTLKVTP